MRRYLVSTLVLLAIELAIELTLAPQGLWAAEVDNFNTEGLNPIEVVDLINDHFNSQLKELIEEWRSQGVSPQPRQIVKETYHRISGSIFKGRWDEWFHESGVPYHHVETPIYWRVRHATSLGTKLIFPAEILYVNGTPIGEDKIRHFLDMGYSLYRRVAAHGRSDRLAIRLSQLTENTFLGRWVIGVYSNGDLVANHEGYLFFQSLVEPTVIDPALPPFPSIIGIDPEGLPFLQRPADLRLHINSYWNEAMNPSRYVPSLQKQISPLLKEYCDQFHAHPEYYIPRDEEGLKLRYSVLPLKATPHNRLDFICANR